MRPEALQATTKEKRIAPVRKIKKFLSRWGVIQSPQQEVLSPADQHIANLFFNSFRFSQGNNALQEFIFHWLKANGDLDSLNLTRRTPDYILSMRVPKNHKKRSWFSQITELPPVWHKFYDIASGKKTTDEDIIFRIAQGELIRDILFQEKERKRPPQKNQTPIEPDSIRDTHASFARKYGVNQANTGMSEYDHLFRFLRPYFMTPSRNPELTPLVTKLKGKWEDNHPGYSFYPKPAIR